LDDSQASQILKRKKERKVKRDLLFSLELIKLYLSIGYDLSYAWSLSQKKGNLGEQQTVSETLEKLEKEFSLKKYRLFFGVLRQLYQRGGSLLPALEAFCRVIRKDLEKDLEDHLRKVPTESNILLLVFFIPPALLILILPFLFSFRNL